MKFKQILALVFAIALGYGAGQQGGKLWATDYPGGGGGTHPVNLATDVTGELPHGSTSDDSADVHGLDSGAFVLGNLDAAAEFVQRATNVSVVVDSAHVPSRIGADAVTFGTAFNAVPIVVVGPSDNTSIFAAGGHTASTTGFTATGFRDSDLTAELSWIALGT